MGSSSCGSYRQRPVDRLERSRLRGGKTAHLSIHLPKHNAPKLVDEDNGRDNEHESSHIGFIQRPAL